MYYSLAKVSSGVCPQRISSTKTLTDDSRYPNPSSLIESIVTPTTNAGPSLISAVHVMSMPELSVYDSSPSNALVAG